MSNFVPTSPRIISAGFLTMCATVGMPTPPLLSTPGSPFPMSAPTSFVPNFFNFNSETPDLTLSGGDNSLFIRRAKLTERIPANPVITNRKIMDLADLGVDIEEIRLGPKTRFENIPGLSTPDFAYLTKDEKGKEHPALEQSGVGLGIFVPEDSIIHPKPESVILRSCMKGSSSSVVKRTAGPFRGKRRVAFSDDDEVYWPEFYPTELEAKAEVQRQFEESEVASDAFRKLAEHMAERRRRRIKNLNKPYGDVVQGLPTPLSARSTQNRRVCFAQDVLIARYCAFSMHIKPQQETKVMSPKERGQFSREALEHDKRIPMPIGVRLRQASKKVEEMMNDLRMSISPAGHSPIAPPTPKLKPVVRHDDMSPMDALPSPGFSINFSSPPNLALVTFEDTLP